MEFICLAILFIGGLSFAAIASYSHKKYIEGQLKPFCKKEHLEIEDNFFLSGPKITGYYKKFFPIAIDVPTDNKNPITYIEFHIESSNFYFHVYPRNDSKRTGDYSGTRYTKTGNERFDLNFIIESNKPEKIKEIFKNHIQQKLLNCREKIYISLEGKKLHCKVYNQVTGTSRLTEICEILYFKIGRASCRERV